MDDETRLILDWLTNDEQRDGMAFAVVDSLAAPQAVADALRLWVGSMAPMLGGTMWDDLMDCALARVDWTEIAAHYIRTQEEAE